MNFNAFLDSLGYMGMGMLGIFIVTAVIIVCIKLLNVLTAPKKKNKDKNGNA